MIRRPPKSTLFPSPTLFRSLRFFPAAKGRLFGALYLPEGHDLSCHGGGKHNEDRKSTRLNSSHSQISYAVFCLKKKIMKYTGMVVVAMCVSWNSSDQTSRDT